jgi:ADP-heptose:LPS heptosyltransferase
MRRWDKAYEDFNKALLHDPDSADAKWTMGLMEMQLGNFERGWELYDERWNSPSFKSPALKTKLPRWEPCKGYKSVLVWCEQGIGDQILYGSLLLALKSYTEKVTVMMDVRLIGLFQRHYPEINFIPHSSKVQNSEYDSQIPIGSIGRHFINKVKDIEEVGDVKYIVPDPERVKQAKHELDIQPGEFVVGLSWASTAPRIDKHKSIELKNLLGLWDIPNVKVVNLQYGKPDYEIEPFEQETGKIIRQTMVNNFFDLEGVAAIMSLCDAVVSVSNANVHIAGALGVPTYVLDANKLWYWNHKNGRNSLFYPSVRLYPRDNMNAPWDKQVEELIQDLKSHAKYQ